MRHRLGALTAGLLVAACGSSATSVDAAAAGQSLLRAYRDTRACTGSTPPGSNQEGACVSTFAAEVQAIPFPDNARDDVARLIADTGATYDLSVIDADVRRVAQDLGTSVPTPAATASRST